MWSLTRATLPCVLLTDRVGLTDALSGAVARRGFVPGHDRGRVLADVATMITSGGEATVDINILRHHLQVLGSVASPPTVWRALDELDPAALARVEKARAAVRARVWGFDPGWPAALDGRRDDPAGERGRPRRGRHDRGRANNHALKPLRSATIEINGVINTYPPSINPEIKALLNALEQPRQGTKPNDPTHATRSRRATVPTVDLSEALLQGPRPHSRTKTARSATPSVATLLRLKHKGTGPQYLEFHFVRTPAIHRWLEPPRQCRAGRGVTGQRSQYRTFRRYLQG